MTARRSRYPSAVFLGFLVWLPVSTTSLAQTAESSFGDTVDVRVFNVEVVVENRDGKRVTGLGPESFRLLVDGRETPIAYFTEVRGGRAVAGLDEDRPRSVAATASGEPLGRSILVFVDDYFSVGVRRNRVLSGLREQIRGLGPNDRMAIVAFAGRRLDLLTGWTGSRETLEAVLEQARRRPAFGLSGFSERALRGGPSRHPDEWWWELEREATAVVSTLRGFASAPGRKVLVLLSGGWPAVEDNPWHGGHTARPLNDLEVLEPIVETANVLGYTVYPVDVSGMRSTGVDVADAVEVRCAAGRGPAPGTITLGSAGSSPTGSSHAALSHELLRQSTLRAIAEDTGGTAILAAERYSPLAPILDDTESYYWLGFEPQSQRDDGRHSVQVEVTGGKYEVRSRRGFRDLSREAEASMDTQGAVLFGGAAPRSDLLVELGAAERRRGRRMEVPLRIDIPAGRLTFLPAEGGYAADVELRLSAVDRRGGQSEVPIVALPLVFDHVPPPSALIPYETTVRLRREPHDIAVSLYDRVTGRLLVSTAAVEPAPR